MTEEEIRPHPGRQSTQLAPVAGSLDIRRLMIGAALSLTLVYGLFWIFEVAFLGELSTDQAESLSMARGIVSLVVLSIVIWGSLLLVPAPLRSLSKESDAPPLLLDDAKREQMRVEFLSRWYMEMRWVAIIGTAFLVGMAVGVMRWLPPEVLPPLISILLLLLAFNLTIRSFLKAGRLPKHILLVQAYTDLIALLIMIHFAGGLENPLYILALFHVIIAGIILSPLQCYLVAATAAILMSLIAWLEWSGFSSHYTLAIIPHGHDHNMHSSKDAGYVASVTAIYSCALFLSAYFTTKITSQTRADESEIHSLAQRMIESQNILEQSLDTTRTAIRVLDRDRKPKWKNRIWDRWFPDGLSAFPEAAIAEDHAFKSRAGKTIEIEEEGPQTSAEGRWYRITFAALEESEKEITQIVELATDITREKAEQDKMVRAEQLAAVGKLASHVAHEVNNPITIMGAKARLLLSRFGTELPEKVVYDLEKIVELSDRVAQIAQGLLSYSRPSPKQRTRLDLKRTIQNSIELIRQELQAHKIQSEIELPDIGCYVDGNEGELSQVFLNLFMNAIDAMPDGGKIRISLKEASRDGGRGFEARIEDTGSGIPPNIVDKIFEPFFTTKDTHKGTGLGLSICYGLISSHDGHLGVESTPEMGTTFTLWLPLST